MFQGPDCFSKKIVGTRWLFIFYRAGLKSYYLPNNISAQLGSVHTSYQTHHKKAHLYDVSLAELSLYEMGYCNRATKHALELLLPDQAPQAAAAGGNGVHPVKIQKVGERLNNDVPWVKVGRWLRAQGCATVVVGALCTMATGCSGGAGGRLQFNLCP
jgi:hypothetical protein